MRSLRANIAEERNIPGFSRRLWFSMFSMLSRQFIFLENFTLRYMISWEYAVIQQNDAD